MRMVAEPAVGRVLAPAEAIISMAAGASTRPTN